MKCPCCGMDMEEGGLISQDVSLGWVPLEQFQRRGLKKLIYTGLRTIGQSSILFRQTKVPNAFFCKNCNIVTGIFDVTNHLDESAVP